MKNKEYKPIAIKEAEYRLVDGVVLTAPIPDIGLSIGKICTIVFRRMQRKDSLPEDKQEGHRLEQTLSSSSPVARREAAMNELLRYAFRIDGYGPWPEQTLDQQWESINELRSAAHYYKMSMGPVKFEKPSKPDVYPLNQPVYPLEKH